MSDDPAHLEAALPGFCRARAVVKARGDSVAPLGFVGTKFDFYRFANRFRLVTCFQGLRLDGFTEETTSGYDALTRAFFAWSAFERYAEMANDRAPYRRLFAHHPRKHVRELAAHCRALDPEHRLIGFLLDQSILPAHATFLARYRDGHDFSVLTLAASMRHIFAHGILTAHPNGLPAENLANLSRSLGNFLIHFIRSDFARRVALAEKLPPP
ncbi:hypothetical protein [Haloferula sargassicola]|uniref:Tetracyclin repressor-like C-terminal domain-containing protein n=1 Tax=Haloferula sargassicola TaxID=490096 RepID=A0ABP9UJJ0_9BACT